MTRLLKNTFLVCSLSLYTLNSSAQNRKDLYETAKVAITQKDHFAAMLNLFAYLEANKPHSQTDKDEHWKGVQRSYAKAYSLCYYPFRDYDDTRSQLNACKDAQQSKNGIASTSIGLTMSKEVPELPPLPSQNANTGWPLVIKGGSDIKIKLIQSSSSYPYPHLIISFPYKWDKPVGASFQSFNQMPPASATWQDRGMQANEPSAIIYPLSSDGIELTTITTKAGDGNTFTMSRYAGALKFLNELESPSSYVIFHVQNNGNGQFLAAPKQ